MVFIRKRQIKSGNNTKDYYYLVHNKWIKGKGPRQINVDYIGNTEKLKKFLKRNTIYLAKFPKLKNKL